MKKTEWKDIDGYDGAYRVSDQGSVWSLRTGRAIHQRTDSHGYRMVRLHRNGAHRDIRTHRLVAMAFVANPMRLAVVNHRNENKQDNRASNLEWCTAQYNNAYGTAHDRASKAVSTRIAQMDAKGDVIREWESSAAAARVMGMSAGNIRACCRGVARTYRGWRWAYLGETKFKRHNGGWKTPVIRYGMDGEAVRYGSIAEAAADMGVSDAAISMCCRGRMRTVHGWRWGYADSEGGGR